MKSEEMSDSNTLCLFNTEQFAETTTLPESKRVEIRV